MQKKRLLMVTFFFPPRPGVASLRLKGLAKYLPEFGWDVVVLTAALPERPDPHFHVEETPYPGDVVELWLKKLKWLGIRGYRDKAGVFRGEVSPKFPGMRTAIDSAKRVVRTIIYPDNQKLWYPHAVARGRYLLAKGGFHAIMSSFGPPTSHLIASTLKLESGLPWIADFRDLWTQNPYYNSLYFAAPIRKVFERNLERRVLAVADALVTVSEPLAAKLGLLYPEKEIRVVTNGFDPDEVVTDEVSLTPEMSITYTGNVYKGMQDPTPLLRALSDLILAGLIRASDVRVYFYGSDREWLSPLVEKFKLQDIVMLLPAVPRSEVLERQRQSHILLVLDWKDTREEGIYTGKLFEYLAAKRPILAFGRAGGVIANLIQDTGVGRYAYSVDELKSILLDWYSEYQREGKVLYRGNWERVKDYSHRNMARKFSELLDDVLERGRTV